MAVLGSHPVIKQIVAPTVIEQHVIEINEIVTIVEKPVFVVADAVESIAKPCFIVHEHNEIVPKPHLLYKNRCLRYISRLSR